MTEENKNEKLDLEEMDQMAGGIGLGGPFQNIIPSVETQQVESRCHYCGRPVMIPGGAYAGIPECDTCFKLHHGMFNDLGNLFKNNG